MRRRYRIHVEADYGVAHVRLVRRWSSSSYGKYITLGRVSLTDQDADDQLADARARAVALAHQVNGLEGDRL